MKKRTFIFLACWVAASQAQDITFGKISDEKAFMEFWDLSEEHMQQYQQYMAVGGKFRFRHTQINPLSVLSIISKDREEKEYFAAKAAKYEHEMTKNEIESAWLIAQQMQIQGLDRKMQQFSDRLTGVDTQHYIPFTLSQNWEDGDVLTIYINQACLSVSCLSHFITVMQSVPKTVSKAIVLKDRVEPPKDVQALLDGLSGISINHYDPIEHKFLDGALNQAVHTRNNKVIRQF